MSRGPKEHCLKRGYDLRLYYAWSHMRTRCLNPQNKDWKDYGGRGITICKRWDSFEGFAKDMGPHPGKGWTLDRWPNNDGNYEPTNCRWATRSMQVRNQRRTVLNEALVQEIRALHASNGLGYGKIAALYGVCRATVADVVKQRWWV